MRLAHQGKTIRGDLILDIGRDGIFAAIGRLDGAISFRPSDWKVKIYEPWTWVVLGPLDVMWRPRKETDE